MNANGREDVARGTPCVDGVPAAVPGGLGLFVRCSPKDLATLRSSVFWYCAAFLPDLPGDAIPPCVR
jgi:hypothetical protein